MPSAPVRYGLTRTCSALRRKAGKAAKLVVVLPAREVVKAAFRERGTVATPASAAAGGFSLLLRSRQASSSDRANVMSRAKVQTSVTLRHGLGIAVDHGAGLVAGRRDQLRLTMRSVTWVPNPSFPRDTMSALSMPTKDGLDLSRLGLALRDRRDETVDRPRARAGSSRFCGRRRHRP